MKKRTANDTELLIQIGIAIFVLIAVIFKFQSYDERSQNLSDIQEAASHAASEDLEEARARGEAQDYHHFENETEGTIEDETSRGTASDISAFARFAAESTKAVLEEPELDANSEHELHYDNARERDFLLNVVGVSREEYQMIKLRRRTTRWHIRHADEIAREKGLRPEQVKAAAINNYIYWMQSLIGVGYYSQLQEVVNGREAM